MILMILVILTILTISGHGRTNAIGLLQPALEKEQDIHLEIFYKISIYYLYTF